MVTGRYRNLGRWRNIGVALVMLAAPVSVRAQPGYAGTDTTANLGISPDYPTEYSTEPLFSPVFTSPVQQLFSPPDDFPGIGTTGQLPSALLNTGTTLDSVLVQPAAVDPLIAPMAAVLATLPAPGHRHPPDSAQNQQAMQDYFCLTQAQQNAKVNRYWSLIAPSEPQAGPSTGFAARDTPDRQAANDPADTNNEWCSANLPTPWAVEPFNMNVWGVAVVLSLGIFAFWAARGFKSP